MPEDKKTDNAAIEQLQFVQFHKPSLDSGEYEISVEQKLKDTSTKDKKFEDENFKKTQKFVVKGDRFSLSSTDIHSMYPPPGGFGDYHAVVPHIVLNRSTLPWERKPKTSLPSDSGASWLALLLFDISEAPELMTKTITLNKLNGITLERGQKQKDIIKVIEVDKSLLDAIVPSLDDLEFLSHIRLSKDAGKNIIGGEKATILCNRLPKQKSGSTVHLVSLENYYPFKNSRITAVKVTLVSLHSWTFTCDVSKNMSFTGLLEDLDVGTLRLPATYISGSGTGAQKNKAKEYLAKGYVPLRHEMRMGQKTVSWYHGPLAPAHIAWLAAALPAKSADELLHYNKGNGLFDVSYAAAWEHGRMLALQDPKFSMEFFHWKKQLSLNKAKRDQMNAWAHITADINTSSTTLLNAEDILLHGVLSEENEDTNPENYTYADYGVPKTVETFFDSLRLLKGVSFDYLVPDEEMLPAESIRFFRLDPVWVDCLLDGAFSLGEDAERTAVNSTDEHEHDQEITGFLLRSKLVGGWPGLLINGYDKKLVKQNGSVFNEDQTKKKSGFLLPVLRSSYLSEEVLFVLFNGDVKTVDFFLAPDTIHFGLDIDKDTTKDEAGDDADPITGEFWQVLRDIDGVERKSLAMRTVPFRVNVAKGYEKNKLVIDIAGLAEKIKTKLNDQNYCSADFALQMIEGAEKVRILRT